MKESVNWITVLKYAGAFVAFMIGSGFATGQEVMQFLRLMVSGVSVAF